VTGSADTELSRAVLALLAREPFFAHVLAGVERVFTPDIPTAGVTVAVGRLVLLVNPDFLVNELRNPSQRAAVLKHEVLHLVLRHIFRCGTQRDAVRWNVATDLVVNQLIGRPWSLPADAVTLARFPGLPADQTAERYYDLLDGATAVAPPCGAAARHSDHSRWPATARGPAYDDGVADLLVDRLVTQSATRAGRASCATLPGTLVQAIDGAFARAEPQVDWRRAVRLFGASSRRTRLRSTYRQPSTRYGTLPGVRVQRLARLAVAVDTSGSISKADLGTFFAEVHGIWRSGSDLTVVECDSAVGRHYPYRGSPPAGVGGRGGTAFDPVFTWLRADRAGWDGCVYLTDGRGPAPRVRPSCPVLWVITPGGSTDDLPFGRVVRLDGVPP
jgi:predicted metal-dependent peptidase